MGFQHDNIRPFPESSESKKAQVIAMFDSIAKRYDLLNSVLSLRIHKLWRKRAIKILRLSRPKSILDVATGTADFAINIQRALPNSEITGIDISTAMLNIARQKLHRLKANMCLVQGDAENLPFADKTFQAITIGFGVRNFQDLRQGLNECYRVLANTGQIVILEFSRPQNPIIRRIYNCYSRLGIPRLGKLCSGNGGAYAYLQNSASKFPAGEEFAQVLREAGFAEVTFQPLSFGICTLYLARKN